MSFSSGSATMEDIFGTFCAFGGGMKDSRPSMDGSKFGKFCRDTKIIDKKLTSTDVDIIFAQVKGKTERKISFDQFMDAVHLMAEKKYVGEKNATFLLQSKIMENKGPSISGTTKSIKSDAVERMTDASHYTGTHKERFDDGGKGRGGAGRDSTSKGRGSMPGLVGTQAGYVSGYKGEGKYSIGGSPGPSPTTKKRDSSSLVANVTDRLTDTSKYTGAHKHRFDDTGHGLGQAGRDAPVKGHGMSPGNVGGQTSYVHGYKNEGSFGKK